MHFVPSSTESWFNLPRERGIAYAAQESWVQNATFRENILFGSQYDETRYRKGVYVFFFVETQNKLAQQFYINVRSKGTLSCSVQVTPRK